MKLRIAFDATARSVDVDGRLHISKSHISKAGVNGYYGREIPNADALGLDLNKIYRMFRSPEELQKAAPSFARLPILSKHIPISADNHPQELVVGAIGSDVVFNDPYLDADTCYWNSDAIDGIESGVQREHSSAYRYGALMIPGEYQGQPYDGQMIDIIGNHLALVEAGRAGPDVLAADSSIKMEIDTMKHTKWGSALLVSLGGLSPKLAQDSALPALVGESTRKTFNKAEARAKILAMDAAVDPVKLDIVMDGMTDEDDPKPAEDEETDEEKEARLKKENLAADADKEDDKKAMDAAIKGATDQIRKDMKEANEARIDVRDVVGDVIAQDSAAGIYGFALDQLNVKHEGVTELAGLKALFAATKTKNAAAAPIAQDSAPLLKQFPNASRFNRA